jgi:hypothetical protein
MTPNMKQFMAYAAAFEQTFADNDWTRLERYFTEDAVYQVSGHARFACELHGRDNIFRGMRRSLDGFDRKMASREIVPTAPPSEDNDSLTFRGFVRYRRAPDAPPIEMHATIVVEFDGDRIRSMHDSFALDAPANEWLARNAADLDGSYV